MTTATDTWTTIRLIRWMTEHFEARGVDAPRVVAEMLLAHVLAGERMHLYMEPQRAATPEELEVLRALVRRAAAHEPVQHLVGKTSFYGRELLVDGSTLIPQPCTEDLVGAVLSWARARAGAHDDLEDEFSEYGLGGPDASTEPTPDHPDHPVADPEPSLKPAPEPLRIADVGTGGGCIAVSIALALPGATVLATDIVPEALALAARNIERFALGDRVELREGSLLDPLRAEGGAFDVIVSNPPYIPDAEWTGGEVQESVRKYVPETATRGGADGLDLIRPIVAGAAALLAPGGLLVVEIAASQRDAVLALARAAGFEDAVVQRDSEGYDRHLVARRPD